MNIAMFDTLIDRRDERTEKPILPLEIRQGVNMRRVQPLVATNNRLTVVIYIWYF